MFYPGMWKKIGGAAHILSVQADGVARTMDRTILAPSTVGARATTASTHAAIDWLHLGCSRKGSEILLKSKGLKAGTFLIRERKSAGSTGYGRCDNSVSPSPPLPLSPVSPTPAQSTAGEL